VPIGTRGRFETRTGIFDELFPVIRSLDTAGTGADNRHEAVRINVWRA
jgi:hypothetical protein